MKKKLKVSLSSLSKETQRRVKRELSQLKQSKRVLSNTPLSEEAKSFLNEVVKGTWTQRPDGKIDVNGRVDADYNKEIQNFLGKEIFFGDVTGSFWCDGTNITSLKGAPREVGKDFSCAETNITSLEGAPEVVGGYFSCRATKITNLKGIGEVEGKVYCAYSKLESLEGAEHLLLGLKTTSQKLRKIRIGATPLDRQMS